MISPTGSGTSPSTPTVSSRPGMNCSAMTSASYDLATRTAASNPSALRTSVMPTEEPIFDGLTITGHPSAVVTSSGATGAMNHAGTGTPAARTRRLARSLSMARALASAPLPVYGTAITSSTAWRIPPSPRPACRHRNNTSAPVTSLSPASPFESIARSRPSSSATAGGSRPTAVVSSRCSSVGERSPVTVSTTRTVCPRPRSASTIWAAPANATARSAVAPPVITAIRIEDLVLPQPLVVEDLRQIPLSGVGQHGHHERLRIVDPPRHVQRSHDVDAGRASGEQGLFLGQAPHHQHGVLVGHRDPLVDHVPVQRGRQFVAADTLHLVGVALGLLMGTRVLGVDRADRVAGDHTDPWVLLLEEPTRPAHRTARPRCAHEVRDLPRRLLPQLGTGRAVVHVRV